MMSSYENIIAYLRALYEQPLFERNGIVYPSIVHTPSSDMGFDALLGRLHPEPITSDDCAFYDYGYLHSLQNQHPSLYNGYTFALDHLRLNPLRLDARVGRYFDMLATCAALNYELEQASERRFMRLPSRVQFHRDVDVRQAITRGYGRSAAIGVAILVVFNHGGVYKAVMARRSANNATDSGRYHLLPAFIFQPLHAEVRAEEWSIVYHIWREYLEELFGMPEHSEGWQTHRAYQDIQERIAQGSASLHLTGITTNLMTLRPEVCGVLVIDGADWYERITTPGSDMPLNAHAEAQGGHLHLVSIETDEALHSTLPPNLHRHMPPQGAVAFWLGVDKFRRMRG